MLIPGMNKILAEWIKNIGIHSEFFVQIYIFLGHGTNISHEKAKGLQIEKMSKISSMLSRA